MKTRIVLSLAMIVVTLAGVTSATVAYFTATATNSNNTFSAGTLSIDFGDPTSVPVTLSDMQPSVEKTIEVKVRNIGSLPANIAAYATGSWDAALDPSKFWVTKAEYFDGSNWITFKTGSPINGVIYYSSDGSASSLYALSSGSTVNFRLTVKLADDASNDYQGKTFTATINVGAKQTEPISATFPPGF